MMQTMLRTFATPQRTGQSLSCAGLEPKRDLAGLCGSKHTDAAMPQSHRVDATRWARVKPEWRSLPKDTLPLAFDYLKSVLSAEEYARLLVRVRIV